MDMGKAQTHTLHKTWIFIPIKPPADMSIMHGMFANLLKLCNTCMHVDQDGIDVLQKCCAIFSKMYSIEFFRFKLCANL